MTMVQLILVMIDSGITVHFASRESFNQDVTMNTLCGRRYKLDEVVQSPVELRAGGRLCKQCSFLHRQWRHQVSQEVRMGERERQITN